uniref:5-hydroxytryptamine receptor 5A n=1 Tax=Lygus hesperus TaxID=30085 RepID=A0A0A9YNL7_LYGHE
MDTRTFKHDGNENADILAKEGSRLRFIGVSKNACKEKVKKWETQDLNILWSKETDKYRQTRMLITSFDPKQASWLTSKSRNTIRIMTGILTGHYDFRRMLNIMDERVSPMCPCEQEEDTAEHFLCRCDRFWRSRTEAFGHHIVERASLRDIPWRRIKKLLISAEDSLTPTLGSRRNPLLNKGASTEGEYKLSVPETLFQWQPQAVSDL